MSRPLVLVADDDEDIRLLVLDVLEKIGCSVISARDGKIALELASQSPLALAVLDGRMPLIDGLTVTRRLKADPATRSLPVLILTASVGENQEQAALDAGADAFLAKPFDLNELRATARSLLDRPSTPAQA
jgi:CheY-like chemotaxis protein